MLHLIFELLKAIQSSLPSHLVSLNHFTYV